MNTHEAHRQFKGVVLEGVVLGDAVYSKRGNLPWWLVAKSECLVISGSLGRDDAVDAGGAK